MELGNVLEIYNFILAFLDFPGHFSGQFYRSNTQLLNQKTKMQKKTIYLNNVLKMRCYLLYYVIFTILLDLVSKKNLS
jgi:hypothetical protein